MSRLAWFPFYVDDFLGGTSALLPAELGAYLSALLAQWQSGDVKGIPNDPIRLAVVCRGSDFTCVVRNKFAVVEIGGHQYLRNERLAREWDKAKAEHDARVRGGKSRAQQAAQEGVELPGELPAELPHNPLPTTHNPQATSKQRTKNASAPQAPPKSPKPRRPDLLFEAIADVCAIDWKICTEAQRGRVNQTARILRGEGHTVDEVTIFGKWWVAFDWRGKEGQPPTPEQIRENWKRAFTEAPTGPSRTLSRNLQAGEQFVNKDKRNGHGHQ